MQDIATTKSEIAALMTKVNDYSGNNISQQLEFRSYLKQADKVYGQPDEPRKNYIAQENTNAAEQSRQSELTEKSKDNSREYAKPVEQKSSAQTPNETSDDVAYPSSDKDGLVSDQQDVNQPLTANGKDITSKQDTKEPTAKLQSSDELKTEQDTITSSEQAKQPQDNTTIGDETLVAGALNSINQNHEQLDEVISEDAAVDEENLIDWLSLLEKSIAKASDNVEPTLNKSADSETDIATEILAQQTDVDGDLDSDLTLLDLLSQKENSELIAADAAAETLIANPEIDADNPQVMLNVAQNQPQAEPNKQQINDQVSEEAGSLSVEQETSVTLDTLTTLVTELQSALNASEQTSANGDAESTDELLTRIGELLEQLDPKVMDKLRETLSIESDTVAMSNNMMSLEDIEAQDTVIEDMQLLLSMLHVANTSANASDSTPKGAVNGEIQQDGKTTLNSQTAEIASNTAQQNNLSSKPIDKQLAALLDLPAEKLDAALTNLAQRLDLKSATAQVDTSQTNLKTDFVSALKSGIEEVKAQMKQGHQPAIDLSALVNDAANKVNLVPIVPEVLDQSVTRFNQSLELTSQLNAKIEQLQHNFVSERNLVKENVNQAQHLQTKQGQQIAQFDKAVNITRNEGLQQLTEKVRWMANQNNLQAEIRLDPPDLGAMKVRLNMSGDTASVNIVVQSQQARDVLDQATPRLKELLEQQGIELGQSSVQQESSNNSEQDSEYVGTNQGDENMPAEESQVIEQRISNGRLGGIDYFV
ncbi:MAG: flagellar hook-length control protein FliK [Aliiglaciecola sp.]|uniref:flagellar hook-length control protein FliK n=1 Tax=Aliiglaciecola sp. TaxID=1872441 RepID=UPI003296E3DE